MLEVHSNRANALSHYEINIPWTKRDLKRGFALLKMYQNTRDLKLFKAAELSDVRMN